MACFRCVLTLLMPIVGASTTCPPGSLDTGQLKASRLLVLEGSVGGTPADLSDGVMAYCPNIATQCLIQCEVGFFTPHSPSHAINGKCYSAGGMGRDLPPIGIIATDNHPNYTVHFPCHAINNYSCMMNATIYSQRVTMQPDTTVCATPTPPSTSATSTPPAISNGNVTNGTTTIGPPRADDGFSAGGIAGTVVGGLQLVIVVVIATFFILLFFAWVRCDTLRSRVNAAIGMMCSCAYPHNEPPTDAKLDTGDDNEGAEMVFGLTDNVSGSGWLQRVIAITRGPRK